MARVATGYVFYAAHFVFLHQGCAQGDLIRERLAFELNRVRAARLLITHVEYLIARAQILFRRAMTAKAPLHLQRFLLIHQRHLVNRAMARVAADALGHVDAVIEKNEIGKLVHARPLQRFTSPITGAHWLKQLRVGPNLRMAVHAGFRRRNACETRRFDRSVAVAAIDAEPGHVMLMAERHWLRLAHAGVGNVRRSLNRVSDPSEGRDHKYGTKNCGSR